MQTCHGNKPFYYKENQTIHTNIVVNMCVDKCNDSQIFYHDDLKDKDNPFAFKCASECPKSKPYFDPSNGCVVKCKSEIWYEVSGRK